jgi:hypothetical protein
MADASRPFPPPWRAARFPGGDVVRDGTGQALCYLYLRENEAEARQAKVLTADEARRIGPRPPFSLSLPADVQVRCGFIQANASVTCTNRV